MWYLLVAAGAGYLATKWQNGHKLQLGCGQNGRTSPSSSPSGTPERVFSPSSSNSMPTSPSTVHDSGIGINAVHQESSTSGLYVLSDKDHPSSPQEIKFNKRSSCEAFLVNPIQVEREDPLVYTSKHSLNAAASIHNKEEPELKEESSSSPSSCCSSNSTVINSPVDTRSILQRYDGAFRFQGKEQGSQPMQPSAVFCFQGKKQNMQLNTLSNQTTATPVNTKVGDSPRHVESESPRDVKRESSSDASVITTANQHADGGCEEKSLFGYTFAAPKLNVTALASPYAVSVTHSSVMLDAGIHTPLSFTGKRPRDDTRADALSDDFLCTHISHPNDIHDTSQMAVQTNGSSLSPCRIIGSQRASDNMGDVDGDAFVSFGIAMAVGFMVSTGKQEMEKMGKVLRETEDLVSDMRKELEERKLRSCMDEEDNNEFFTIRTKDEQECTNGMVADPIDTVCKNGPGFCDDESVRSDVIDVATQNRLCIFDTEICKAGPRPNADRNDLHLKRGTTNGELQKAYCDYEDESDLDEAGDNDCTMSMIELERKLWQVFQERQEERILELEEALELALNKLHAKEEELCWWKNRASWLMEQSFGSTSGELFTTRNRVKRVEGFEGAHSNAVSFDS